MPRLERHAAQLGALGHPVRLRALRFIVQAGEDGAAAGDIQAHVDVPASTLSHHLKRLRVAGLVATRRVGRETICTLRPEAFGEVAAREREILGIAS